jgi:low affinity Fe/Cu permease
MSPSSPRGLGRTLEGLAHRVTVWTGSTCAFLCAAGLTVLWLVSGPIFGFSDTWQLVMNTVSSIVTFLMVFLLQRSQNKDALAMHLKLDELVAAVRGASNRLIDVEDFSEDEVRRLQEGYRVLAEKAKQSGSLRGSLSVEETRRAKEGENR